MKDIRLAWTEVTAPVSGTAVIENVPDAATVHILDARQVGPDIRYQVVVQVDSPAFVVIDEIDPDEVGGDNAP